jgi:hypothetical protein
MKTILTKLGFMKVPPVALGDLARVNNPQVRARVTEDTWYCEIRKSRHTTLA